MWGTILTAIALVLVIEGIMPFLSPNMWRQMMAHMSGYSDKTLRFVGLSSMLVGVIIMALIHSGVL